MSKTVEIIVKIKDSFSRVLKNATAGLESMDKEAKQTSASVDILGKKTKNAFSGMASKIAAASAAFVGFQAVKSVISTFAGFDDMIRQVGAVSNATASELDELTKIAQKMGAETRYSARQSAEGLKLLAMAGFKAKDSIAALPGVLNLAASGNLEIAQAADIATNVLSAYGKGVDELGSVNDVEAF